LRIADMIENLQIEGRDRRGRLLSHVRALLMLATAPLRPTAELVGQLKFATPTSWRTFENRLSDARRMAAPHAESAERKHTAYHLESITGLLNFLLLIAVADLRIVIHHAQMKSFEQTVKICTTDPMPLLVAVLRRYQMRGILHGPWREWPCRQEKALDNLPLEDHQPRCTG